MLIMDSINKKYFGTLLSNAAKETILGIFLYSNCCIIQFHYCLILYSTFDDPFPKILLSHFTLVVFYCDEIGRFSSMISKIYYLITNYLIFLEPDTRNYLLSKFNFVCSIQTSAFPLSVFDFDCSRWIFFLMKFYLSTIVQSFYPALND